MATASIELIQVLRRTVQKLEVSTKYQWGHMGACNCGFLAQEVTQLTQAEIHSRAMLRTGDWSEQLNDYCPVNGLPFDDVISRLVAFGFDPSDLRNLERLSDPEILNWLPPSERDLHHNVKADVVKYLRAWIANLEEKYLEKIIIDRLMIDELTGLKRSRATSEFKRPQMAR